MITTETIENLENELKRKKIEAEIAEVERKIRDAKRDISFPHTPCYYPVCPYYDYSPIITWSN